jgi:glycosyltransferase involved in cell wall biosynthesis
MNHLSQQRTDHSRAPISVTLITLNEAENLRRALESVAWADEIIVVDSGSTDGTPELAAQLGARVTHQPWLGYGAQKNVAHRMAKNPWILNIDADEAVSPELAREIQAWIASPESAQSGGATMPRKTFYWNRWILHGGWYPNRIARLGKNQSSRWTEPKVHEKLLIEGQIAEFRNPILHFSFKNIHDQVTRNIRYAKEGAEHLVARNHNVRVFHLIFKPIGKFIECYLLKRGFLDGLAGFVIAINASHSMFLKYAFALEQQKGVS